LINVVLKLSPFPGQDSFRFQTLHLLYVLFYIEWAFFISLPGWADKLIISMIFNY